MRIKSFVITLCILCIVVLASALLQPTLLPLLRTEVRHKKQELTDDAPPVGVTFVITTAASPIHPSTCIIDETIASIPVEFPIVIGTDLCDSENLPQKGSNNSDNADTRCERFESYKKALREKYSNTTTTGGHNVVITGLPSNNATGRKLVRNLRHALSLVSTEFVVIVQDDMPFLKQRGRSIPFSDIVQDMLKWDNLTYVSFSMMGRGSHDPQFDVSITGHAEVVGTSFVGPSNTSSYMTTSIWTDNNFICKTSYMSSLLKTCQAPFPEWCQMAAIKKDNYTWDKFQTWRYGAKGSEPTIHHLDGRNSKSCHNNTFTGS
eukprot:scaffold5169_cov172-Amphora_coffeaeformis.AAC.26